MTFPTLYKDTMSKDEDASLWVTCHPDLNLDVPSALKAVRAYNDAIRGVARDVGAILVDLDRIVPKDLEHLYDEAHPTSKGCDVIAHAIVDQIVRDGKLMAR